jgi:hypothetical protein
VHVIFLHIIAVHTAYNIQSELIKYVTMKVCYLLKFMLKGRERVQSSARLLNCFVIFSFSFVCDRSVMSAGHHYACHRSSCQIVKPFVGTCVNFMSIFLHNYRAALCENLRHHIVLNSKHCLYGFLRFDLSVERVQISLKEAFFCSAFVRIYHNTFSIELEWRKLS